MGRLLDVVSNVGVHDVDHSELAVRVLEVAEELVVRVTGNRKLIHSSFRTGGQRHDPLVSIVFLTTCPLSGKTVTSIGRFMLLQIRMVTAELFSDGASGLA